MANEVVLNNYSDDAKMKQYINNVLMPRVFHDIPLNILNTGLYSIINEYMSQAIEQLSFTSSFFLNESFITKAVLPDSIYAEAAIFNLGYSFAIPSSCNFLLELKIEDILKNSTKNPDNGLYEFILDKNTQFNLSNGNVYSLDYDILIQYAEVKTDPHGEDFVPAWNVQYTNMDSQNSIAKNKNPYIIHRVTNVWLCLFVQASEYQRQTHTVVNNTTNNIPNEDKVIQCTDHICGFDIKYIDGEGNEQFIPQDHILPINKDVADSNPYVHYIMDNPQTIRFMFQLNGNKYFVPKTNSSYEITIYTCHGKSANFTAHKKDEQPLLITATNRFSNNANVLKASFVISGSLGGTDIGTTETVRRETIEAYNTANVISSDHDIDEWFKTFYFKNVLYPFFFKRRDDPWGRIWSGYLALTDYDNHVFRTNTLHGLIPYEVLYNNNDNTVTSNEIIIPPGWIWTYIKNNPPYDLFTVTPYTKDGSKIVETAKTLAQLDEKFVFANPFGIRIQKSPFAIGYFNPWIDIYVTSSLISHTITSDSIVDNKGDWEDPTIVYHATPLLTNFRRTYQNNYYTVTTFISPSIASWLDGSEIVKYVRQNATPPVFAGVMWNYFKHPLDLYSPNIPMLPLTTNEGYLPFNPDNTYFCVRKKNAVDSTKWSLQEIWIEDMTDEISKKISIPITGDITMLYGDNSIWGTDGLHKDYIVYATGDTDVRIYPDTTVEGKLNFERIITQNYYELRLGEDAVTGTISEIVIPEVYETELTKYGNTKLYKVGDSYSPSIKINIYFQDGTNQVYTITNSANVYIPYTPMTERTPNGEFRFDFNQVGANGIILYADMKPAPESGSVDYYRIPFSAIPKDNAIFYIENNLLPTRLNNMRVVLHAFVNGTETGRVEMQPVNNENDGSYRFEVNMHPLNELIDIDDRINIASTNNGGGSWIPANENSIVNVDASNPEFRISIFFRSNDANRDSDIVIGDSFTGFRLADQYEVEDVLLIQELKEMRSVVKFGDSSVPNIEQINLYKDMISLDEFVDTSIDGVTGNINSINKYAYNKMNGIVDPSWTEEMMITEHSKIKTASRLMREKISYHLAVYTGEISSEAFISNVRPEYFDTLISSLENIIQGESNVGDDINWEDIYNITHDYSKAVNTAFETVNVTGGVEIQLMPFVQNTLMTSDRFPSFVSAFTQVHKAIEPVIMHRLEGNNYLDCKLIATYGKPHTYTSDTDYNLEGKFWPDLNVQVEFDVKLYDDSLSTNTINELKNIVRSYFNRLTSIHTAADMTSMNNNIYISHVIQQMEGHSNVAYMKYRGFYTNEKNIPNGNYMSPSVQAIVQKWKKLEDFPTQELERFVPEMFVLEDDNIVINIIK